MWKPAYGVMLCDSGIYESIGKPQYQAEQVLMFTDCCQVKEPLAEQLKCCET